MMNAAGCRSFLLLTIIISAVALAEEPIGWGAVLRQDAQWYSGPEARRIADNVILWQRVNGGWPKNTDMTRVLDAEFRERLVQEKQSVDSATFDNNATHTQMRFLAKVHNATGCVASKEAFLRGLDYIFLAQYPNGGWPQRHPASGYSTHITYNDGAMIGVLQIVRDIANVSEDFAFIDDGRRASAKRSLDMAIECIVKTQVVVDGKKTAWCAQHDSKTLEPALARSYELPSISGAESVGIVQFLMAIEKPTPEVIAAVESAVTWFDEAKITGMREDRTVGPDGGRERYHIADPDAPPMWGRFHEIGTNRIMFVDRDGIPKYSIAEIGRERRNGYAWVGTWPQRILDAYPDWAKKYTPGRNVLAGK